MPSVCVGTTNPVKIAATLQAFTKVWPEKHWDVFGRSVDSGVPDQPMTMATARLGALTRAGNAMTQSTADFGVGMEGGLWSESGSIMECGWIAIVDRGGRLGWGATPSMLVPPAITELLRQGMDLNQACEAVLGQANLGTGSGFFGVMTNCGLPRLEAYRDGAIFAMARFTHPDLYDGHDNSAFQLTYLVVPEGLQTNCAGCGQPIAVGQHYLDVVTTLGSNMGPNYRPVRDVEPTALPARVHDPDCWLAWVRDDEIIRNVFAR